MPLDKERLDHNLTNHPPSNEVAQKMEQLRTGFKLVGSGILAHCPDGRERSLALTNLEQACMWSMAALARDQPTG